MSNVKSNTATEATVAAVEAVVPEAKTVAEVVAEAKAAAPTKNHNLEVPTWLAPLSAGLSGVVSVAGCMIVSNIRATRKEEDKIYSALDIVAGATAAGVVSAAVQFGAQKVSPALGGDAYGHHSAGLIGMGVSLATIGLFGSVKEKLNSQFNAVDALIEEEEVTVTAE